MTTENLTALINHLTALGNGTLEPVNWNAGICEEISNYPRPLYVAAKNLMRQWPKYTGNVVYPVPHDNLQPVTAYLSLANVWANDQYGDNRRELCLFLASELEQLQGAKLEKL